MAAGASAGSYLKDPTSFPLSNMIALQGPALMLAFATQTGLAYLSEGDQIKNLGNSSYNASASTRLLYSDSDN